MVMINETYSEGHENPSSLEEGGAMQNNSIPLLQVEMLPKGMSEMAEMISESQQLPLSMAILALISTVSACVCGKWRAKDITRNWRKEMSSLYICIIAESGGRKSVCFDIANEIIRKWQRKKAKELYPKVKDAKKQISLAEDRIRDIEEEMEEEGSTSELLQALEGAELELEEAELKLPIIPDMIINDATPEAMEIRLQEHYGRGSLQDPEGGPLKNLTGDRWKSPPSFELLKKGWSGEYHRVDRIGRGSLELHQPQMNVGLMVQPVLIEQLAKNPAMRGEGLWNRFLFLALPSMVEDLVPSNDAPDFNPTIADEWNETLERLLEAEHNGEKLVHGKTGKQKVPILHDLYLSDGAKEARHKFEKSLIAQYRIGGRLEEVSEWAMKAVGIAIRIATVFHLFERASKGHEFLNVFKGKVSKQNMERAIKIVDTLSYHFVAVMVPDTDKQKGDYVLSKIRELGYGCTRRALLRKTHKNKAYLDSAIEYLVDESRIRVQKEKKPNGSKVVSYHEYGN